MLSSPWSPVPSRQPSPARPAPVRCICVRVDPKKLLGRSHLKHFIETEANLLTHVFCFSKRYRDSALRFWLSPVGYGILKANNVRRHLRTIMRNRKAARMRAQGKIAGLVEMNLEDAPKW